MKRELTTVEFAGDNPCVVLYDESDAVLSAISYWRTTASPRGVGEALFVLRGTANHTLEASVFSDSTDLAGFLTTFNQHFEGFQSVNLDVVVQQASFNTHWGAQSVELECVSSSKTIRVEWKDLGAPYIRRSDVLDFGKQAGRSYEVSSVIMPASSGSIVIDGKLQPGRVKDGYGALPKSAFLAFCETWTRLG